MNQVKGISLWTAVLFLALGNQAQAQPAASQPASQSKAQCEDGLDNDRDGWTDLIDRGCRNSQDSDEADLPDRYTQCADQLDNDQDGKVDGLDEACLVPTDLFEDPRLYPQRKQEEIRLRASRRESEQTSGQAEEGTSGSCLHLELPFTVVGIRGLFVIPRVDAYLAVAPGLGLVWHPSGGFEVGAQAALLSADEENRWGLRLALPVRYLTGGGVWGWGLEAHAHFVDLESAGAKEIEFGLAPNILFRVPRTSELRLFAGPSLGWIRPGQIFSLAYVAGIAWLFP